MHCDWNKSHALQNMNIEDKPLFQATLGDLKEMIEEMFAPQTEIPGDPSPEVKKQLVYGLAGLAKLLGVCKATASTIKSSGILDPAISQHGKVIVIDANLALELMKAKKNSIRRRNFR